MGRAMVVAAIMAFIDGALSAQQEPKPPKPPEAASAPADKAQEHATPARKSQEEVVVTATRVEEKIFDVPQAMSLTTPAELERRQPNVPGEALREEAGVTMVQSGGHKLKWSPIIRGRSTNRYIAFLWNGARIQSATIEQNAIGFLDHIEVIRGPAGVQYGSDAMAGTVNIFTKQVPFADELRTGGEAYLRYGSVDQDLTEYLNLYASSPHVTVLLGATHHTIGNMRTPETGPIPHTGVRETDWYTEIAWSPEPDQVLRLSMVDNRLRDADFYVQSRMNANGIPRLQRPKEDRDLHMISYEYKRLATWVESFRSFVYYNNDDTVETVTTDNAAGNPTYTARSLYEKNHFFGLGIQASTPLDVWQGARLVYGIEERAELRRNHTRLRTITKADGSQTETTPAGATPDTNLDILGAFLLAEFHPAKSFEFSTGVRYETSHFTSNPVSTDPVGTWTKDDIDVNLRRHSVTWNVGAINWFTDEFALAGLVATGYRLPNFGELLNISAVNSTSGTISVPSPDLDPEQSVTYQIGPRYLSETVAASVTAYWTQLSDVIVTEDAGTIDVPGFGPATARKRVNSGRGFIRGVEVDAAWTFVKNWTVFANATVTRGEDTTNDNRLDKIPPANGLLGIRWETDKRDLWVEGVVQGALRLKHTSPADKADLSMARDPALGSPSATSPPYRSSFEIPGYAVVNLRAGAVVWKDPESHRSLTITLNINNLLNRTYREAYTMYPFAAGTDVALAADLKF